LQESDEEQEDQRWNEHQFFWHLICWGLDRCDLHRIVAVEIKAVQCARELRTKGRLSHLKDLRQTPASEFASVTDAVGKRCGLPFHF